MLFLFIGLVAAWLPLSVSAAPADTSRAAQFIDTIVGRQKSITSLQCKYHHKRYVNKSEPTEYQGTISYQAPEKILMHLLVPTDEYVLVDDSTVLIYGIANEYGIRYHKKCLSGPERQIADQIGLVKMNMIETMRPGYTFAFADTSNPETWLLSATPKGGWKSLGKITIRVDARKKCLKGIELFGKDGMLVSSTTYSEFVSVGSPPVYFPGSTTVVLSAGEFQQTDVIEYSRIRFNPDFTKNHFEVPVAKNAEIVDNSQDCK